MARRRRHSLSECGIFDKVRSAFRNQIKFLIEPAVWDVFIAQANREYAEQNVLRAAINNWNAEHPNNKVKLDESYESTEVKFSMVGSDHLPMGTIVIEHPPLSGEYIMSGWPRPRTWTNERTITLVPGEPNWSVKEASITLSDDVSESLNNCLRHLKVIDEQFKAWLRQFDVCGKDDKSVAAFYSTAVRLWLNKLYPGECKTYMTRPRKQYTLPMSSELNEALHLAYQLLPAGDNK